MTTLRAEFLLRDWLRSLDPADCRDVVHLLRDRGITAVLGANDADTTLRAQHGIAVSTRRAILPLLALVAGLLGCGEAAGPTAPATPTRADMLGAWTLAIEAAPGCWPASTLAFRLNDAEVGPATTRAADGAVFVNVLTARWVYGALTGTLVLTGESGSVLNLWKRYPDQKGQFVITRVEADRLVGTFVDVGSAFALAPHCQSPATATQ